MEGRTAGIMDGETQIGPEIGISCQETQRERLIAATVEAVAEAGVARLGQTLA